MRKFTLSLLLVLATVALYNGATRAPFLNLDDVIYVTQNPEVLSGLNRHSLVWAFTTTTAANWHPLTWLSHEVDCQMFGLNPAGPHMVNVLLHALNAALLFWLLAAATGTTWRSLMVAALFALHPINVESVVWIAERKNVLSMFFFLLALGAYGRYARRPGLGRHLAVAVLYALALMAKPQVITFPFALLLLDYWPLDRAGGGRASWKKLVWEKIPWFLLSAASAAITMKAQGTARHEGIPVWLHVANAGLAYAKYVGKTFWPADLAPLYPHPGGAIDLPAAVGACAAIVAVSVLAVIFRGKRYLFAGWFWFLGTMVPMVGLVQVGVQAMADRYAYIPVLGIFVIVCWGVPELLGRREEARAPRRSRQFAALVGISVFVLSALSFALRRQVNLWTDNLTLWQHTLAVTKNNFIAEDNVATALLEKGRPEEAIEYFRRAQAIRPGDPISKLNIASYEQQHGNAREAIAGYDQVIQLTENPTFLALAHSNRGFAYLSLGDDARAGEDFRAALAAGENNSAAYLGLGMLARKAGDLRGAERDFRRSVEINPTAIGYEQWADVLDGMGEREAAERARAKIAPSGGSRPKF
ncbi:MAG TPA: tetratricopeptide repeat protein [Candidatus Saccharimonadales bacterium]|nr:tetratricopeptide repeat protein [Candidatus Saccharimonadales bacterium]